MIKRLSKLYQMTPYSAVTQAVDVGKLARDARLEIKVSAVGSEIVSDARKLTVDATVRNITKSKMPIHREFFRIIDAESCVYAPLQEGQPSYGASPDDRVNVRLSFGIPAKSEGLSLLYSDSGSVFVFKGIEHQAHIESRR